MPQNLHAKLFISKKGDNLYWFLGSANATQPAFERNIEFIVELKGKDRKQYPATILRMLTSTQDKITLFEPYRRSDRDSQDLSKDKTRENDLRKIVYDLTTLPIKGSAEPVEGGAAYNLIISIDATKLHMKKGYTVRLRPLPEENKKAVQVMPGNLNVIKEFTGYTETRLSPFVVWEVSDSEGLQESFLAAMEITLPDTRLGKIFKSIIDSQDKFIKYLTFILTGTDAEVIGNNGNNRTKNGEPGAYAGWLQGAPVFEKLMLAASRYPERIESVNQLIKRLKSETQQGEDILPKDLKELLIVFDVYLQRAKV